MAITAEMRTSVLELYTAYFNRAADTDGVNYWLNEMDTNGWTIDMVAQSFADQTEYTNVYGALTNAQIVDTVYTNVLNRTADAAGQAYWLAELDSGVMAVKSFVQAVVNAATEVVNGTATHPDDKAIVDNKSAVSQYAYDNNYNITTQSLATITADAATVTAAQTALDTAVAATVVASHTLTTATDVLETTGADTFTATSSTLNAADIISDNSTTDSDTLNLTLTTVPSAAATITNVENINVNIDAFAGTATTFNATNVTGATITLSSSKLGFDGAAGVTAAGANNVTAGSNVSTLTVAGLTTGTVDGGSATTINVTGTAAKANTIKVNNTATVSNTTSTLTTLDVTADSTVTYNPSVANTTTLTGDANVALKMDAADVISGTTLVNSKTAGTTSLQVTTAGTFDATNFAVDKIIVGDTATTAATVASGAVLETNAAMTSLTVDTTATTATTATINAGHNITTLDVKDDGLVSTVNANTANITIGTLTATGETVNVAGSKNVTLSTSDATTINASALTGNLTVSAVTVASTITGGSGANSVTTAAALNISYTGGTGVDTIDAQATTSGTVGASLGAGNDVIKFNAPTGIVAIDGGSGTDTVWLKASADTTAATVTLANIETIEIQNVTTAGADTTSVTMDGSTLSGKAYTVTEAEADDTITVNVTNDSATTDLSGLTLTNIDKFVITGQAATTETIKGTSTVDEITANTGAKTITTGTGNDKVILADNASTSTAMTAVTDFTMGATSYDTLDLAYTALSLANTSSAISVGTQAGLTNNGDVTASVANGIMSLTGLSANVGAFDTFSEMLAAANEVMKQLGITAAADKEYQVAFAFGGNTYVVDANYTNVGTSVADVNIVELTGVTSATAISETAAANTIAVI